jgi:hypothetical protein
MNNKITWNNGRYENSDGSEAYCSCGGVPHCHKYNRDGRNIGLALAIAASIDAGVKSAKAHMESEAKASISKHKDLPTPCELRLAMDWIHAGCPAYPVKRFGEPLEIKVAIDVLYHLMDVLPSHFPQYCWGTPEHLAAMIACQEEEERSWEGDGSEMDHEV